jgi:serine/threonine protein kinase
MSRHSEPTRERREPGGAASSLALACLSENLVLAFVSGHASEPEWAHVEDHLDQCPDCADLVYAAAHARDVARVASEALCPTAFAVGSVLAERFTICRFVARGGMGEVYEAFDRKVPERVALKTMLCTLSDEPAAARRLCEEVKLARRIAHRHVCRIHELHEHRDAPPSRNLVHFLAMEFVDGETLKAHLSGGPIPPRAAGRIARQLLEGLGAAHAAGVLHLDFKSQNVMLRAGVSPAEAVIMDFSLSRTFDTEARLQVNERQLLGSPGYMSPEQLECRTTLGPESDIYSFGVVLFEMLTGRLPFHGERAASMMAMQLERPSPAPSAVCPGLTSAFDPLVARCLAKKPGERFADAASALAALERCLALPLDRESRRRRLFERTASLLLMAVPLGLGAWVSGRLDGVSLGTRVAVQPAALRNSAPDAVASSTSAYPNASPPRPEPPAPSTAGGIALPVERASMLQPAAEGTSPPAGTEAGSAASGVPPSFTATAAPPRAVGPARAASVAHAASPSAPRAPRQPPAAPAPARWTPQRAPARLY